MGSKVVVAEDVVVGGGVAVDMAVVKVMVFGTCDDECLIYLMLVNADRIAAELEIVEA